MKLSEVTELRELLEHEGSPTVSIYLPLHGHGREAEADRLRFRGALDRAGKLLAGESGATGLLEGLEGMTEGDALWGAGPGGVALFLAAGFRRGYRVPAVFEEQVVVGSTFHTRPFVEYLTAPQRFYVLELSQKRVQLWEGSPDGVQPVHPELLPRSLVDALGYEFEREEKVVLRRKERDGSHGEHGRGGIMPVFHGHGVGLDDREPELEAYFRKVDEGLREHLRGRDAPLFLATVEENEALYRRVSGLANLSDRAVTANVRYWTPEELHRETWPLAEAEAEGRIDDVLGLWERARGRGEGESDLANLAHLAVAGRLRLLLTERGRSVWGRMDPETGRTEVVAEGGSDPSPDAVDLLDELAEIVIRHGGDVLPLPAARMPTATGAAGILR